MESKRIHIIDAVRDADALVDILSSGAVVPIVVTGSSMVPFLKESRDTVYLQQSDATHRGQIVFFRRPTGEFTLHRVRKIYSDGRLLINGDAQNWCEIIYREQVLASVVSIVRNGRHIDPNSFIRSVLKTLWYPTRPIRPFIWKTYSLFRRLFTKH